MDKTVALIIALLGAWFFSAMKIAFVSANKLRLELDKSKNRRYARFLNFISRNTWSFSLSMIIGYVFSLILFALFFKDILSSIFCKINPDYEGIKLLCEIVTISIAVVIMEALPNALGKFYPNVILNIFAIPSSIFNIIFFPITRIMAGFSSFIVKILFNDKLRRKKADSFGKDDLNDLVTQSRDAVSENPDSPLKFFQNALEFSDLKVRECMIPRTEILAVEKNESEEVIKQKFIESGFSKILVFDETIDNITGYIKSKEIFQHPESFKQTVRTMPIFPETMPINKLLAFFIRTAQNMAVIVDEFGGTSGIITIEDILEEIVGEIEDEHDTVQHYEKQLNEKEYIFSARLEIDYINEKYDLNIPEDDEYETLAGLILYHTERLPSANDTILIEDFEFKVIKVTQTRVELLKLSII